MCCSASEWHGNKKSLKKEVSCTASFITLPVAGAEPNMKIENLGCSSPALLGWCALNFITQWGFLMPISSLMRNNLRALLGLIRLFIKEVRVLWLPFRKGLEVQSGVLADLKFSHICCVQAQIWMGRWLETHLLVRKGRAFSNKS